MITEEKASYRVLDDCIAAINNGGSVPYRIGLNKEFRIKYKHTDGWRGYYYSELVKTVNDSLHGPHWEHLKDAEGWMTGDWDDASRVERSFEDLAAFLATEGKEMLVIFLPTSNVFSTAYDVYARKLTA